MKMTKNIKKNTKDIMYGYVYVEIKIIILKII